MRSRRSAARGTAWLPTVADLRAILQSLAWRGSVRFRTTVVATLVVAAALLLGALVFIGIVDRSLTNEVLASVRTRASDLSAMSESGILPARLVNEQADDEFIQVVDNDGEVVAFSPDLRGAGPVADLANREWTVTDVPYDDERFLAYALETISGDDTLMVIVGRTLEPVAEATALVGGLLSVGLPLVLAFVAFTTWIVVGWALAPVDRMRREVDAISARELHRRIEAPIAEDEIARLARTMNGMLDRLETAQARQREFVSDTSHELRSPIASIRQQAEVARAHPDRVELGPLIDSILEDVARLQAMVENLLLLARADERSLQLREQPVDLDDLVFDEIRRRRFAMSGPPIDASGVTAARVLGDDRALRQVVRNLLDNAARHAVSAMAVSLREVAGRAVLNVDDDGPGIPPADRQRVFERFARLDEARGRESGGAGLGLAIVSELVGAHEGNVTITDGPLGGACVQVDLPLAPEHR